MLDVCRVPGQVRSSQSEMLQTKWKINMTFVADSAGKRPPVQSWRGKFHLRRDDQTKKRLATMDDRIFDQVDAALG